jgi:hypothetical protein
MLGVIELDVERFIEACGKTLQRRLVAFGISVTDQTHGYRRRRELPTMTVSAGLVTGKTRRGGVVRPFVTGRAGN